MNRDAHCLWLAVFFYLSLTTCSGQMKNNFDNNIQITNRKPAVAGSFYPYEPESLKLVLAEAFQKAVKRDTAKEPLAVIVPHAGYIFSSKIAASAFNQIDPDKVYEHIFVIGSSHRSAYNSASVYPGGNFITPLGLVPVDTLAITLIKNNLIFIDDTEPHKDEHCIEVQLPFLQYYLKHPFSIVPILIGTQSVETCRKIGVALAPYFNEKNLFIISSDFSHYPNYADALYSDSTIADAIIQNSFRAFLKVKQTLENSGKHNLLTCACGWTSILTLLSITENNPDIQIRKVDYMNSGDVEVGDKSKVVGYSAIVFDKRNPDTSNEFSLTDTDKKNLLHIARNTLKEYLISHHIPPLESDSLAKNLSQKCGAFVSLHKKGELRGCIGTFQPSGKLYNTIQEMAISAAVNDYRFNPVTPEELNDIDIEISVLTPLRKIHSIDEIELGKHGIYIKKGNNSGTFLPQVASGQNWTKEDFLGHCSRDKAGLGWNGWKDAEIYIYEAIVFSE
jgi:MEMO1 family protein